MIIAFFNGRLGNQLFQIVSLRTYFPTHRIVTVGFDDFHELFFLPNILNIPKSRLPHGLYSLLFRILGLLSSLRLISSLPALSDPISDVSSYVAKGAIRDVVFAKPFYNQWLTSESLSYIPSINDVYLAKARQWLADHDINQLSDILYLHIRRTDFSVWPTADHPALLDLDWYTSNISRFTPLCDIKQILVFTDDPSFVLSRLSLPKLLFVNEDPFTEFAIMSLCPFGILSPSSFSWWASYLSSRSSSPTLFLAPLYWAGHRLSVWYPKHIYSHHLVYTPVMPS